jgi:hypothetical protein
LTFGSIHRSKHLAPTTRRTRGPKPNPLVMRQPIVQSASDQEA